MTIEEIYQFIPESFTLTNHKIKVTVIDRIDENNYGDWSDINNEIRLSRTLKCNDEIVELTKTQIENEEIKAKILEVMTSEPKAIKELQAENESLAEYTNQKL